MKERPILMSGGMVRATLEDRKRQTRRVIKPQPVLDMPGFPGAWAWRKGGSVWQSGLPPILLCPYGQPGDRLWIRETWVEVVIPSPSPKCRMVEGRGITYRADWNGNPSGYRWRPSIHMPRWASRLTLDITGISVERLQNISEADAKAEGAVDWFHSLPGDQQTEVFCHTTLPLDAGKEAPSARDCFFMLWDSINAKRAPCSANPWVWVVEYKRLVQEVGGSGAHDSDGRPIGYNVKARCDHPGCNAPIHRGLTYVCGIMHGGGDHGCGRYFCTEHLMIGTGAGEQLCDECFDRWKQAHGSEAGEE